jgi:inorganic pyrophosphatase/exopolyphosphatase
MLHEIQKHKIPDDVLYIIFKQFLTEKKLVDISSVNKEWANIVNKRLMIIHLKKIIQNTQKKNEELEVDNFILKQDNVKISDLYDDLIDTVETFMDINEM